MLNVLSIVPLLTPPLSEELSTGGVEWRGVSQGKGDAVGETGNADDARHELANTRLRLRSGEKGRSVCGVCGVGGDVDVPCT